MRYTDAVAAAPPGSERFGVADLGRLSRSTLVLALAPGPASPPLEELATGLGGDLRLLASAARGLPDRSERLFRLALRPATAKARAEAGRRLVRGLFWWLVYELEPALWLQLAAREPVHAGVLEALRPEGAVLEVAAGGGRLTVPILERGPRALVAVEPCPPLRARLRERLGAFPGIPAWVVAGAAQRLPVRSGWADLVVACAAFGPHPPLGGVPVLAEMERCAAGGGRVALVGAEEPEWFAARGYRLQEFERAGLTDRLPPGELADFFGSALDPPHELLIKQL